MTKQELAAMSLPYGLKGTREDGAVFNYNPIAYYNEFLKRKSPSHKPILFPLSQLTKPIQLANYNRGEPFVPIVKLFELLQTNHFHKEPKLKYTIPFKPENILSCEYAVYESLNMTECILMYSEHYTNMNAHLKSFRFNPELRRFITRDETENRPLGVAFQLDLFQQLIKWHFNLLDEGIEFVECNEDFNPYKQ